MDNGVCLDLLTWYIKHSPIFLTTCFEISYIIFILQLRKLKLIEFIMTCYTTGYQADERLEQESSSIFQMLCSLYHSATQKSRCFLLLSTILQAGFTNTPDTPQRPMELHSVRAVCGFRSAKAPPGRSCRQIRAKYGRYRRSYAIPRG